MIPVRVTGLPPLRGGVNNNRNHMAIKKDEAFVIDNCHLDGDGIAFTRKGSRLLDTTALDGGVTSVYEFVKPSGGTVTREVLVTAGSKWYSYSVLGGFTEIQSLSNSSRPSIVTFVDGSGNAICVLANGTDFLKYDGTTVSNLTTGFQSSDNPRYLEVYDNRLIAAGCDADPNKVYTSNLLDPTTWGASAYFTIESDSHRERVTGLGAIWSFLTVSKGTSFYIITEGDTTSSTVKQVRVSSEYGVSSHWGMITVGNYIFFGNESGLYYGYLREAVEDGLLVVKISGKVSRKYKRVKDYSQISVVFDPNNNELIWGVGLKDATNYDLGLVFNLGLSVLEGSERRFVWSGFFRGLGYEPYTFGLITNSSGRKDVWRGDEEGYVYVMGESNQYKDEMRRGGVTTSHGVISRVWLGPFMPQGGTVAKRFFHVAPFLYQNYNGSTTISWVIDSMYLDGEISIELDGNIPYWEDGTSEGKKQEWYKTIWASAPMIPALVDVRRIGKFIEVIIENLGENDADEIAYGGGEVGYQILGRRRMA